MHIKKTTTHFSNNFSCGTVVSSLLRDFFVFVCLSLPKNSGCAIVLECFSSLLMHELEEGAVLSVLFGKR